MILWIVTIALAVVVIWLGYRVMEMTNRVDDLESWVLPRKEQEQKERERQRLRDAIERGFEEGIIAPPEVLREAYPDTYPPDNTIK
jgi:hypothetical protein